MIDPLSATSGLPANPYISEEPQSGPVTSPQSDCGWLQPAGREANSQAGSPAAKKQAQEIADEAQNAANPLQALSGKYAAASPDVQRALLNNPQVQRFLQQSGKQFILAQLKMPNADPNGVLHLLAETAKTMNSAIAAPFIASAMVGFDQYRLDHKLMGQPIFFSGQAETDIHAMHDQIGCVSRAGDIAINHLSSLLDKSIEEGFKNLDKSRQFPGDSLPAMKDRLLAHHPNNPAYEQNLKDRAGFWTHQVWEPQGRTHAVWDPLLALSKKRDWEGVQHEVERQITMITCTSPTADAVMQHLATLLTDWPDTKPLPPQFKAAVQEAENRILIRRPAEAAAQIAKVYGDNAGQGGAVAAQHAAEELRKLTAPDRADPLTAALIFNAAQPTIQKITGDLLNLPPILSATYADVPAPVKARNPAEAPIFEALSAAADSASRCPEAEASIKALAFRLKTLASTMSYWMYAGVGDVNAVEAAAAEGNTALALEMAAQLKASKQSNVADILLTSIGNGFHTLREATENSVQNFAKTIAPLEVGRSIFGELVPNTEENWIKKHPDFEKKATEQLNGVNALGYRLIRVSDTVEKYLPELNNLSSMQKLHKESGPKELKEEPALYAAVHLSLASLVETARSYNAEVLSKITTWTGDPNQVNPEYGWNIRQGRAIVRNSSAYWRNRGNPPPNMSTGASLLGVSSYLLGMYTVGSDIARNSGFHRDHATPGWIGYRGWRDYGRVTMYGIGGVLEAIQLSSNILNDWKGFNPAAKGLTGQIAKIATGKSVISDLIKWHNIAFGFWNVAGTFNFLAHGDYPRAAALGTAAAGNLLGNYAEQVGIKTVERQALAKLIGSGLTELGAFALLAMNIRDAAKALDTVKGYGKDYLVAGGVNPELAEVVAEPPASMIAGVMAGVMAGPLPDDPNMGSRLVQVAKYLDMQPKDFMQWLNRWPVVQVSWDSTMLHRAGKQTVSTADSIVLSTNSIRADRRGNLIPEKKGENIVVLVPAPPNTGTQFLEFPYDSIDDALSHSEYYRTHERHGTPLDEFLTLHVHANTLKGYRELMDRLGTPLPKPALTH